MCRRYTLEWLDSMISVSLNPAKTNVSEITDDQLKAVVLKMIEEKDRLQSLLKNHVFRLTKEKQIELFLKKYHSALVILLDQASENDRSIPATQSLLKKLTSDIIICLNELLSLIEVRFSNYFCLNERVPVTYLLVTKKELKLRIDKVKLKLSGQITNNGIGDLVFRYLYSFINSKGNYFITFQEMLYVKELLKELEGLEDSGDKKYNYSSLDVLLIYLNFNSKDYLNYLTHTIADKINAHEDIAVKMDCLLYHFKEFNQMHRKVGIALYPQQVDLKELISNWFTQEIFYLEKKLHLSIVPLHDKTEKIKEKAPVENEKAKVLCILSTDQTGLILRAADELKILIARSMNEVFKTIVPNLSTPYKENLSYDSMRSKSYAAEERDKKIAIETLEKIIEKIKSY